jgi:hypothetical protein
MEIEPQADTDIDDLVAKFSHTGFTNDMRTCHKLLYDILKNRVSFDVSDLKVHLFRVLIDNGVKGTRNLDWYGNDYLLLYTVFTMLTDILYITKEEKMKWAIYSHW